MKPGMRFGRLVVLQDKGKNSHRERVWLCLCDCGKTKLVVASSLRNGLTASCGCLRSESTSKRSWKHGNAQTGKKTREYRSWQAMKTRCHPSNFKNAVWYSKRRIRVCHRWENSFALFLKDMGLCPKGCQLERLNNNKGYQPGNCAWKTGSENCNNKRNNRILILNGISKTVTQWAKFLSVPVQTLFSRLYAGWSVPEILSVRH